MLFVKMLGFVEQKYTWKVLINPRDELAFWNLVGTTDGVGPKTAQKIFKQFEAKDFEGLQSHHKEYLLRELF